MVHVPCDTLDSGMELVRAGDRVRTVFGTGTVEAIWEEEDGTEVVDVELDGEATWMSLRPSNGDLLVWLSRPQPWPED